MSRLYSFVNSYLSEIQRGLQTAKLVNEMWINYVSCGYCPEKELMASWAQIGKTIIILDGGNHAALKQLNHMFIKNPNHYPFAHYYEDIDSLNGAMTVTGIILPSKFDTRYDRDKMVARALTSMREPKQDFDAKMSEVLLNSKTA